MHPQRILVLGGYGTAGLAIAELLLANTGSPVAVVIAGRRLSKAKEVAARLGGRFGRERVEARWVDAAAPESLRSAFRDVTIVVVASSTSGYTRAVAEAALSEHVDYIDIIYSTSKLSELSRMKDRIERAGLCFITDGGFHPGLPAMLVRHIAGRFDSLQRARVGSVIRIDWASLDLSASTLDGFVEEFADFQSLTYVDGRWRRAGTSLYVKPVEMDFGEGLGRQPCYPMYLDEMRSLPDLYPELLETGFFVGGFGAIVDFIVVPLVMAVLKVAPRKGIRPMGRLMGWSLRKSARPPFVTALKVEASGFQDGQPHSEEVLISSDDAYLLTAAPVVSCLLQYLDGSIRSPGLWLQAHAVDPKRVLQDIGKMDIRVSDSGSTDSLQANRFQGSRLPMRSVAKDLLPDAVGKSGLM